MKSLILLLFLLFSAGCLRLTDVAGSYATVSVRDENVIAAAEFAIVAQQAVMNDGTRAAPGQLTLLKIQRARQQVVAGMNYNLRLKVKVDDEVKQAQAIVWHQAWREPEPYQLTSWTWE
jgi:hypothetical protein